MKYSKLSTSYNTHSLAFMAGLIVMGICGYLGNRNAHSPSSTDYQLNIHNDTVCIYDGERLVSRYTTRWNSQLDSVIMKDNN